MTSLSRSKSCGGIPLPKASFFRYSSSPSTTQQNDDDDADPDYEDDGDACYYCQDCSYFHSTPITTPFISPRQQGPSQSNHNFTIASLLLAALRKSLLTCSIHECDDVSSSLDIGCPTDVQHVSHVTFDRFNGFLGLPIAFQPDVPLKVPSASSPVNGRDQVQLLPVMEKCIACVFGVSVDSMHLSYDERGNSVPTILLLMQKRLYSGGGLQAEGIFRINGENGQEEEIRKQLNGGVVPQGVDVHCLAGLIKAWFRELPAGILDSLTPEQVMHCNSEDKCTQLAKSLPPTESALLDWAINLMADVVKYDQENKMNARNIAMVFAPNMTQMADPLTALIHAVQIMNLLKTLIIKTLRERQESTPGFDPVSSSADRSSPNTAIEYPYSLRTTTLNRLGSKSEEQFWSFPRKSVQSKEEEEKQREVVIEGILERLSFRKGVRRLCRYPVFQMSKPSAKKSVT